MMRSSSSKNILSGSLILFAVICFCAGGINALNVSDPTEIVQGSTLLIRQWFPLSTCSPSLMGFDLKIAEAALDRLGWKNHVNLKCLHNVSSEEVFQFLEDSVSDTCGYVTETGINQTMHPPLSTTGESSAAHCCEKCYIRSECVKWSFDRYAGECALFDKSVPNSAHICSWHGFCRNTK